MAIWLFRRRSKRRHARDKSQPRNVRPFSRRETPLAATGTNAPLSIPANPVQGGGGDVASIPEQGHGRISPSAYSFESGHKDELHIGGKKSKRKSKRESAPPLGAHIPGADPATYWRANSHRHTITATPGRKRELGGEFPEGDNFFFGIIPTLHSTKRDSGHLMSRKLTKRRKNSHDREREAELKAARNFTPLRPAIDAWSSGRLLGKDSRRVGSGFAGAPWERENFHSDVSLPRASSIHSSLSSDSEQVSYRISGLDALAPKPTLRYSVSPRWDPHQSGGSAPAGTVPHRRAFTAQIPEETLKAHKRVDDLADDLNARDLRELMDRDKRRRQRKREREQEKVEKKLAWRAERERQAMEDGVEIPPNLERGVFGREALGGHPERTSAVLTSSRRRQSVENAPADKGKRVEGRDYDNEGLAEALPAVAHAFHRVDSVPMGPSSPFMAVEEPVLPPSREQSPKATGFLRSKKSRSKSSLSGHNQLHNVETPSKASESSSKGPLSWISIFKWGRKRNPGPSSFSNTSRDSMSTSQQPSAPTSNITFIPAATSGRVSTVPKRTRSRFREDLPELPMSPPDSRTESPENKLLPPTVKERPEAMPMPSAPINIPGRRYDTPTSMMLDGASPEPQQPMSLASIDSEASWLSGGRMKDSRLSAQMKKRAHRSVESNNADREDAEDDSAGVADDDYLHRVARRVSEADPPGRAQRGSTGEAIPSSNEDESARWGTVSGRQPSVTKPRSVDRIKSREGLLNTAVSVNEDDDKEQDSPVSPSSVVTELQRATSINLGNGHARQISAGKAKLLNLSPRTSLDTRAGSLSPQGSEPADQNRLQR